MHSFGPKDIQKECCGFGGLEGDGHIDLSQRGSDDGEAMIAANFDLRAEQTEDDVQKVMRLQ